MRTTDPKEIQKELNVSRETAQEISFYRSAENRAALAEFKKNLPALREKCDAAYDAASAAYRTKNPAGKNGHKSALRKARELWAGYDR